MNTKILLSIFALAILSANALSLKLHTEQEKPAWFTYDQAPNEGRCTIDNECDGQRTCQLYGWECQGTARPAKNENYRYDQAESGNRCPSDQDDSNYANRDYYCDGNRTCSRLGWCQGTSR